MVNLTFRFGSSKPDPSRVDLERALHELFEEGALGLPVGDLEEHPNAWLQYGYANGEKWSVVTVDVYHNGVAILTKYDDQDDDEPIFEHRMGPVSQAICLGLWQDLAAGLEEKILQSFRGRGPTSGCS